MEKLYIIILGACNSGKSTLINQMTGQQTALVSDMAGTTTDPVRKHMELPDIGAAVLIDTAGFDDTSDLGTQRIQATRRELDKADIAVLLTGKNPEAEADWRQQLRQRKLSTVEWPALTDLDQAGRSRLFAQLLRAIPEDFAPHSMLPGMVKPGDMVVLVMPQDSQAPVGRLILPQVQTIRELLDLGCTPICCTPERLKATLHGLKTEPALIITDSQVFGPVEAVRPAGVPLTSFSILMAARKGDIDYFRQGMQALQRLDDTDGPVRVLIAEACTHAPKHEDIGRVKIPALLRQRYGQRVSTDFVRGIDFPADLSSYDLIVHCGGCMFNRRMMMARIAASRRAAIPMTNYGLLLQQGIRHKA